MKGRSAGQGNNNVRPNVWTKVKERTHGRRKTHGTKTTRSANKRETERKRKRERPRSRSRPASSLSDMKVVGELMEEEACKPLAASER